MILKWHTLEMVSDCLYLKKKKKNVFKHLLTLV